MLSEHRDMAAAQAFFRSARAVTGVTPERVTTDGHGSYPRAIRSTLGRRVVHRTSAYRNNGLEQDHRGVKGRTRCMRGFNPDSPYGRYSAGAKQRNLLRFAAACGIVGGGSMEHPTGESDDGPLRVEFDGSV